MRMPIRSLAVVLVLVFTQMNVATQDRQQPSEAPGPAALPTVKGTGTAGTVPVWIAPAKLGDSHIRSGTAVTISAPLQVTGTTTIDGGGGNLAVVGSGAAGLSASGTNVGVVGSSTSGTGVRGQSSNFPGIHGISNSGAGARGESINFAGVQGVSANGVGVLGSTDSASNNAVVGEVLSTNPQGATGVIGHCSATQGTCNGVVGDVSTTGTAVIGFLRAPAVGTAVHGYAYGTSGFANGVVGETWSPDAAGVIGLNNSSGGQGVRGGTESASAIGVLGYNTAGGKAGQFQGDVLITEDLSVFGNAYKPGGGSWSTLSDRRTKNSIAPIDDALNQLLSLRGVTFEYTNPPGFGELPGTHLGMVAQEVEQVMPSWIDVGPDGYKRLTFRGFEALAVEAVRELKLELKVNSNEVTSRIENLERENAELRRTLQVLSDAVKKLQRR